MDFLYLKKRTAVLVVSCHNAPVGFIILSAATNIGYEQHYNPHPPTTKHPMCTHAYSVYGRFRFFFSTTNNMKLFSAAAILAVFFVEATRSFRIFHSSSQSCTTINGVTQCHSSDDGGPNVDGMSDSSSQSCTTINGVTQCHSSDSSSQSCTTINGVTQCHSDSSDSSSQSCTTINGVTQCHSSDDGGPNGVGMPPDDSSRSSGSSQSCPSSDDVDPSFRR